MGPGRLWAHRPIWWSDDPSGHPFISLSVAIKKPEKEQGPFVEFHFTSWTFKDGGYLGHLATWTLVWTHRDSRGDSPGWEVWVALFSGRLCWRKKTICLLNHMQVLQGSETGHFLPSQRRFSSCLLSELRNKAALAGLVGGGRGGPHRKLMHIFSFSGNFPVT